MTESDIARTALGQFILRYATEIDAEWKENIHEGVEYEYYKSEIEGVDFHDDTGDPIIHVRATNTGEFTEKIRSATYNPPGKAHPAEYDTHFVDLEVNVFFYPTRSELGEAMIEVEQLESLPVANGPTEPMRL